MNSNKPAIEQPSGVSWTSLILFVLFVLGTFWFLPLVAITFSVCWFVIVTTETMMSNDRRFVKNHLTLALLGISTLWLFGLGFFSIVTLVAA